MTKKLSKSIAVLVLSMVMVFAAVVPAFAASNDIVYVENHSIIDCPNRYIMNDGNFNFTIKVPRNINLSDVIIGFTANSEGVQMYGNTLDFYYGKALTYLRSDDQSDYYEFITGKRNGNGAGINLYCEYNGGYYMATNNGNGLTVRGRGYWLEA